MPLSRRACLLAPALSPALLRPAAAHALVTESEPRFGATLRTPPTEVVVRFNARVEPERSRLVLFGPDAAEVPLTILDGPPTLLRASVPAASPLAPGAWRLRWQVLAADGHITRGDIPFTLRGR